MSNFDRCPACGVSICLGECGLPVIDGEEDMENKTQYCGYCGDRMFWDDEHDDMEVCSQCLVKVSDEELKELGLI